MQCEWKLDICETIQRDNRHTKVEHKLRILKFHRNLLDISFATRIQEFLFCFKNEMCEKRYAAIVRENIHKQQLSIAVILGLSIRLSYSPSVFIHLL